jgi:hypothetical protein
MIEKPAEFNNEKKEGSPTPFEEFESQNQGQKPRRKELDLRSQDEIDEEERLNPPYWKNPESVSDTDNSFETFGEKKEKETAPEQGTPEYEKKANESALKEAQANLKKYEEARAELVRKGNEEVEGEEIWIEHTSNDEYNPDEIESEKFKKREAMKPKKYIPKENNHGVEGTGELNLETVDIPMNEFNKKSKAEQQIIRGKNEKAFMAELLKRKENSDGNEKVGEASSMRKDNSIYIGNDRDKEIKGTHNNYKREKKRGLYKAIKNKEGDVELPRYGILSRVKDFLGIYEDDD